MLKHNKKGVNFPKIKKIYGCSVHGTWVKIRSIRAILRKKLEEYNKNILFSIKFSLLSQRNIFFRSVFTDNNRTYPHDAKRKDSKPSW